MTTFILSLFFIISFATVFVHCQNPSLPTWPTQYTTTIEQKVSNQAPRTGTWAFDATLGADRFDWKGEDNSTLTEINDYKMRTRYIIETNPRGQACHSMRIPGELPVPRFDGYTFKGTVEVNGETVDHWERETAGSNFQYFDDAKTMDPVRYEIRAGTTHLDTRTFTDFKKGAPNPSLFNASTSFPGLCHNPKVWKPKRSLTHPSLDAESCAEMKTIVTNYFPSEYRTDMICIAFYESSYRCDVYNGICCYGLFQINRNHLGETDCPSSVGDLDECDPNAKCARHVLDTQGLNAWQTWAEGDCAHWTGCSV